ncbi:tol-pal system protein YbgF [Pseudophaeobacter flagellatus]|uniref:tol-pal system protein YbgF n=1 Tax=Pseudophaeobacter flagellatus TaxID=2899119 RepID=UPI001E2F4D33|nr:tol-pal system protein YbgF [Pseudophaeobacter flagellatus]MCD9148403.1 tol-pal system protein YbgF [Pseudophaeobacter flagellatus]
MRLLQAAFLSATLLTVLPVAGPVLAQDQQTLADIRQELTVLHVDIQRLKRELSTTGGVGSGAAAGSSVLDRVGAIEAGLQRLTAQTEQLEYRINRIVADGTNRIGDLEFRLVELEGGDIAALGETTTLGGVETLDQAGAGSAAGGDAMDAQDTELAVGEQADFNAAAQALSEGAHQVAAEKFAIFSQSYPGSPLAPEADFNRGKALDGLGDTREAARAYLASFSGDATGSIAPKALFELGAALGRLGQLDQACITLSEVGVRFPGDETVAQANSEMATLGCS